MAHFAELDENNIVLRVIVVNNNELLDGEQEKESKGIDFCQTILGGTWVQTSYSGSFRARFAGIGYTYNDYHDAFIPSKPFTSWLFNDNLLDWYPPVPHPEDGKFYYWDETNVTWVEISIESPAP